jgi:hypothetical protein
VAIVGGLGCAGPGGGSLKVKPIAAAVEEPANVSVYFTVETKGGEPVSGLKQASFHIFEDGKLLTEKKAKRTLVDPRFAEARFTLILVDLSGPVVDTEYMPDVASGTARVAEAASRSGQVAISVFDGENELVPMLGFGAKGGREAIEAIRKFRPRGQRVSNFNGALWQGLELMHKQLETATAPHKFGNIVIFTDRGDMAKKVNDEELKKAVDVGIISVYVIAVGEKVDPAGMARWGRSGLYTSKQPKDTKKGFADIADKLEAGASNRYVLSYCSPKRKGDHKLEIVVETADEGDHDSGKLVYKFNAEGFTSGCTPKKKPALDEASAGGEKSSDEKPE